MILSPHCNDNQVANLSQWFLFFVSVIRLTRANFKSVCVEHGTTTIKSKMGWFKKNVYMHKKIRSQKREENCASLTGTTFASNFRCHSFVLTLNCKNVVVSYKLFGNLADKSRVNIENITRSVSSEGDNNSSIRVWIIEVLNRVSLSNYGKNNLHLYCNCIFKFFFRTLPTKNQGMVNSRPNQTSGQGKNQWLAHWILSASFLNYSCYFQGHLLSATHP